MSLNTNQPAIFEMAELPPLSLDVLRCLLIMNKTTVKELSALFGSSDRETRYALDCLSDVNFVKKIPNLKNMKSVYFEHEIEQEAQILNLLGINNITEILSHKSIFERVKSRP